jgi:3-methyladenine DNA glycosylase AlkD
MYETYDCDILKKINNKNFLKQLNVFVKNNPCCNEYPNCTHAKIQSNKNLHEHFKELNESIDKAVCKYFGYQPNIAHKNSWVFLNKANEEIDSIRHNHTYGSNKLGISAVVYLTETNFGTVFGDSNKIKPQVNNWNIFDSRLYHQAENGIPKTDRYVLAFDVFIKV